MIFNILSNRSGLWPKLRTEFLQNNPSCAACGSTKKLQVHHIEPVHICKDKELDITNLITLCKTCHFIFGHLMNWYSWNKDVVIDAAVYLCKVRNRPSKLDKQSIRGSILSVIQSYYEKYYG